MYDPISATTTPAVSSKVSAYLKHLQEKKVVNGLHHQGAPAVSKSSALSRRRRRAAQLQSRLGGAGYESNPSVFQSPSFVQSPQRSSASATYVSSSSESSVEGEGHGPENPPAVERYHEESSWFEDPMDHQPTKPTKKGESSAVSALSEENPFRYPMQVSADAAAAWVSKSQDAMVVSARNTAPPIEREQPQSSGGDYFDNLIAETSERWKSFRDEVIGNTTTGRLMRSRQAVEERGLVVSPTQLPHVFPLANNAHGNEQRMIIMQQQAEIEVLRARLSIGNTQALAPYVEDVAEQIDYIPVEHIEVPAAETQAPADDITVWSGWTQHYGVQQGLGQNVYTPPRPHTPLDELPPVQGRPDIDDASIYAVPANRRVRDYPLSMAAANGTIRRALYSGPILDGNQITGVGILKFPETGDLYCGEVVNGEMHGQGTYTFASKKRRQGKVLKGRFDHNVYVAWAAPNEPTGIEI